MCESSPIETRNAPSLPLRLMTALRPIKLSTSCSTSIKVHDSRSTACRTRELVITVPLPMLVKGPIVLSVTVQLSPITTGPSIVDPRITVPSPTSTRSTSLLSESTSPRTIPSHHVSSTVVLAASKSSFLPVSNHQSVIIRLATSAPESSKCWANRAGRQGGRKSSCSRSHRSIEG